MAEIIENDSGSGKEGKRRSPKKHGAGIDMTPMVDLMCLLITFFMLTTAFSKPKVMDITMPEKENVEKPEDAGNKVAANRTWSILLTSDDRIYWYYHFDVPEGQEPTLAVLHKTDYSKDGIRKFLLEKNDLTVKEIQELKDKVKTGALVMENDSLNAKIKGIKKKYNTMKKSPIILIKADETSKYRNLVDIIDEMAIANIASYAVVDLSPAEIALLKAAPK